MAGTRLPGAALLLASAVAALVVSLSLTSHADDETVVSTQIRTFLGAGIGQRVQGLVWRGGIEMKGTTDGFGGLSGMGFTGPDGRLVMVSDRGNFVSGQLIYDQAGAPLSLVGVRVTPILNSSGRELTRAYTRDAEAMTVLIRNDVPSAVRVGFENLTRVADFALVDGVPGGPAREVNIPDWLSDARTNASLEAVCLAPPASPVAGSTLLLTEGIIDDNGNHSAYLLGRADRGRLGYVPGQGTVPTDCAFLPDGDLLVLERGIAFLSFSMRLLRVPAAEVKAGAVMRGTELLYASGPDIDNMEALAVHAAPDGTTRITIGSDNNFNDWQRNLLMEFSLPD